MAQSNLIVRLPQLSATPSQSVPKELKAWNQYALESNALVIQIEEAVPAAIKHANQTQANPTPPNQELHKHNRKVGRKLSSDSALPGTANQLPGDGLLGPQQFYSTVGYLVSKWDPSPPKLYPWQTRAVLQVVTSCVLR